MLKLLILGLSIQSLFGQCVITVNPLTGLPDCRTGATSTGTGIVTFNGLSTDPQTLATPGTAGTAPNWVSSGSAHTLNIPMAATASVTAGLISKAFYDTIVIGPSSVAGDEIVQFNGATGKLVKASSLTGVVKVTAGVPSAAVDADFPSTLARDSEVAAAYQPLDSDLTAIAALAVTNDNLMFANGSAWVLKALVDCANATTSKLLYSTTTHSFTCGTDQSGGGGGAAGAVSQTFAADATTVTVADGFATADKVVNCFVGSGNAMSPWSYNTADRSTNTSQTVIAFNPAPAAGVCIVSSGGSATGGSGAPTDATYIVQTANGSLSGEQALGALATGILKNTTTTGVLSIAVAGDFPTLNQNTTGSAATLTTTRAIYGNNFDGSAALTQIIASTYGGTGNGFAKFSGPTTSEKTFTLPDATATILTTNAAVTVAQGGIGITSGTSGGVLAFTATGTLASSGALTANLPVIGGGAGAAPTVGTRSGNTTAYVTTTGTQTSGRCVEIDANGNHVAFSAGCASGTGTVTVVGAGALTSTAIVTGGGTTTLQTPSATSTLDASGNMVLAGGLTVTGGISTGGATSTCTGGTAGCEEFNAGTAPTTFGTSLIQIIAPTAVTAFRWVMPGAAGDGVIVNTNSSNTVTQAFVGTNGTGNILRSAGTAAITTGKTLTVSNTISLAGTDSTTMTFPSTSATIARTDAANTFTGVQTMTSPALTTPAITGAATWADGTRQTFNPDGTTPGLNFGSNAGDPSTPSNGDVWYNSTTNKFRCRENGANADCIQAGTGSGTVNSGTAGQLAYYASSTTAVSGNANFTISGSDVTLGVAGSAVGTLSFANATSGTIKFTAPTGALGTVTLTLPTTTGNIPSIAGALAVASTKTFTASNTLTVTGTDSSSIAFGAGGTVTYTIASGTKALDTDAIASGACDTLATTTATGVASTDVILFTPNADITAVTGYSIVTTGGLSVWAWPTTNTINWKICNPTSSSITPGAVTLNYRIVR